MNGVGCGFSVERQFISDLPTVGKVLSRSIYKKNAKNYPKVPKEDLSSYDKRSNTIVVADSKEGWASALRIFVVEMYNGNFKVCIDISGVRQAGAPLKVFGGRSSGGQMLVDMLEKLRPIFIEANGRKLTSLECHDAMCFIAQAVISGGVRRCLPWNTPVMTPTGFKSIADIVVGDTVITAGKEAKVIAAEYTGEKELLTIKHRFGTLVCTPEHRLAVFNSFMKYEFKPAAALVEGDRLVWDSAGFDGSDTVLPVINQGKHFNSSILKIPTFVNTDIAWLIGLVHGDGYISESSIEIAGNMHEIHILARAAAIFETEFGLSSSYGSDGRPGVGARLRVHSSTLASWFLANVKQPKTSITIPAFITTGTRDVRFAYLSGLLDADGRVRPKDKCIDQACTIYEAFAEELVTTLSGLGIAAIVSFVNGSLRRSRGELVQDAYNVRIVGTTNRKNFVTGAKKHCFKLAAYLETFAGAVDFSFPYSWGSDCSSTRGFGVHYIRYDLPLLPAIVVSVEKTEADRTFDIQVGGSEQFTAKGLVVHNSSLISLSNLSDGRMQHSKSGSWWEENPQRSLANNSVAYTEKPEIGQFMREWQSLYESRSGERGIFNREAAKLAAEKIGRDSNHEFGTNPSLAAGTLVRTSKGIFPIDSLEGLDILVPNRFGVMTPASCRLSGRNQPIYEVALSNGVSYGATAEHKWPIIVSDGSVIKKATTELSKKDKISILRVDNLGFGDKGTADEGFLLGYILGDGWLTVRGDNSKLQVGIILGQDSYSLEVRLLATLNSFGCNASFTERTKNDGTQPFKELNTCNSKLNSWLRELGVSQKREVPEFVFTEASEEFRKGFIDGLLSADGSVSNQRVAFFSSSRKFVQQFSDLMGFYGVLGSVATRNCVANFPNKKTYGGRVYTSHMWRASGDSARHFAAVFSISHDKKRIRLGTFGPYTGRKTYIRVKDVVETGAEQDVWDLSVHSDDHCFQLSHCVTGNCAEIILRDAQACNLTSIVVREQDTLETLKVKAEKATILGTLQATLTNFSYLSTIWRENCEEERLLGVSMTGVMDHPILSSVSDEAKRWLEELRAVTKEVNKEWAAKLGINVSAAITCVKPEGTSSQLNNTASGLHGRHSPYYIRRVRADDKDPLGIVMEAQGYFCEPDVMQRNTKVFSFPVKSPEGAKCGDVRTALEQLEYWLMFKKHWTDHNPSVTITVRENEWLQVAAWVYENFDEVCGLSFLPHSNHVYRQAPYQEITREEYETMLAKLPTGIDYEALSRLETTDQTLGAQEYACSSGTCDLI